MQSICHLRESSTRDLSLLKVLAGLLSSTRLGRSMTVDSTFTSVHPCKTAACCCTSASPAVTRCLDLQVPDLFRHTHTRARAHTHTHLYRLYSGQSRHFGTRAYVVRYGDVRARMKIAVCGWPLCPRNVVSHKHVVACEGCSFRTGAEAAY